MVKEPAGGFTSAMPDPVWQVPAAIDPLAAMVMGQALPPMTACHVPTIIDWEQTGSLVSAAKAVDAAHKIEATVTMARLRDMRCSGVGRLNSPK
jgi:hypothetical protein